MAIIDRQIRFSNAQAVTAAAASEDAIDLGTARQLGDGSTLYIVVTCTTAMTDGSSDSTLAVKVQSDSDSAFGSPTDVQTIGTFPATSAAGTQFIVPLMHFTTAERYIRLYYTPANGNLTTGSFTAFLTDSPQVWSAYPDAITIS